MAAPLDSYPVPSRRPPVCLLLTVAGSLEAHKQHLSRLLLTTDAIDNCSRGWTPKRSHVVEKPVTASAREGDGRFLPDGLLWLDGERQGDALRLAVRGVWGGGGARAAFGKELSDMIHAAERQTLLKIYSWGREYGLCVHQYGGSSRTSKQYLWCIQIQ